MDFREFVYLFRGKGKCFEKFTTPSTPRVSNIFSHYFEIFSNNRKYCVKPLCTVEQKLAGKKLIMPFFAYFQVDKDRISQTSDYLLLCNK